MIGCLGEEGLGVGIALGGVGETASKVGPSDSSSEEAVKTLGPFLAAVVSSSVMCILVGPSGAPGGISPPLAGEGVISWVASSAEL